MNDDLKTPSSLGPCLREAMLDPRSSQIGMYLFHNGLLVEIEKKESIVDVCNWLNEGLLEVGDDVLFVFFNRDVWSHVMDVLHIIFDGLKMTVSLRLNNKTKFVKLFLV